MCTINVKVNVQVTYNYMDVYTVGNVFSKEATQKRNVTSRKKTTVDAVANSVLF